MVHELAHVCQQTDVSSGVGEIEIARGDDPLEAEAQAAVYAFFSRRPLPRLTRDRRPIVRRAAAIDASSAAIKLTTAGARPAVDLRSSPIVCN